jgi:eukaryotic-like serine/threonine-protein kinase
VIGQRINNYEITALLGQGGMGSVYVAEHPVLGRRAAVKLLRPEYALDENLVARFINEARASSAIHHPGIIEVFDVGTLPEGQPYLMMELLEGETLARRINRLGRLRPPEAIEVASQAASALAAAHGHGIVHRDLKPDNLFLVGEAGNPGDPRVKVLDFGIAKLHRRWTGQQIRTHTGSLMGTPPYMSPEQCRGISSEIDHRTDVYALGIILYEMLVGAPPFLSEGFGDVLLMHLTRPPRPPREIDPAIPMSVEAIVLRALEKEPERRFASMDELGRALAAAATHNTLLEVAPAPPPVDLPKPPGRARTPSGIEPSTTFSSSVGQMSPVKLPYAKSTMHIGQRRQAIAALLGAGLAAAGGIAFFMKGGFGPRAPARSAGPGGGAAAPVQERPPVPAAPLAQPEPPAAPPAIAEPPLSPATDPERPDDSLTKAARARRARNRDGSARRSLSAVSDPPTADRPARAGDPPVAPPAASPPSSPPGKPRVNTEKW